MVMNSSGPIDLHAGTAGRSIATELGVSGALALEGSGPRTLAGVSSGPITMPTDFYGKSNFTPSLAIYDTPGTINVAVPTGCTQIEMMVCGGGGAGGGIDTGDGATAGYHIGGGGGGGGVRVQTIAVTAGQNITITVGAGGSNGIANPNNWTSGLNSTVTYAGLNYTGDGGSRGYFAVKLGNVGSGGTSGSPTNFPGGNGVANRGSGGGGGSGGAGSDASGSGVPTGTGGNGGPGGTFSITGLTVQIGGGGGGGGTVNQGSGGAGGGGAGGGSSGSYYGGGGGGSEGETNAGYGGTLVGGNGFRGAVAIWYK